MIRSDLVAVLGWVTQMVELIWDWVQWADCSDICDAPCVRSLFQTEFLCGVVLTELVLERWHLVVSSVRVAPSF